MRRAIVIPLFFACSPLVGFFGAAEAPSALTYAVNPLLATNGVTLTTDSPSNRGTAASRFTVTPSLPPGQSLDGATGIISRTPIVAVATANYVIVGSNDLGSTTVTLPITVNEKLPALRFATAFVFVQGEQSTTGAPYSSGGPFTGFVANGLPPNLSVQTDGSVSGFALATAPAADYAITATGPGGTSEFKVNLAINPPLSIVPPSVTLPGQKQIALTFAGLGGKPPLSFSVVNAGDVSGNIDAAGGAFTSGSGSGEVVVSDAEGHTATAVVTNQFAWVNGPINALDAAGDSLYFGGQFSRINFVPAPHVLALHGSDASPDYSFDPEDGFDGEVISLAVDGDALYAAGTFESYRGAPAHRLAKVSLSTGALDTRFTQTLGITQGAPYGLTLANGSVYVGLTYDGVTYGDNGPMLYRGVQTASSVLRLDPASGALQTQLLALTASPAQVIDLYALGSEVIVAGQGLGASHQLLALDAHDNILWQENLGVTSAVDVASDGKALFVAALSGLYQVDASSGDFELLYDGASDGFSVEVVALTPDNIFLGGINGLKKLTRGGALQTFTPPFSVQVTALLATADGLLVGGDFGTLDAPGLAKIAFADASTVTAFDLQAGFDARANTLVANGSSILVGGTFTAYRGIAARNLARYALDTETFDSNFATRAQIGQIIAPDEVASSDDAVEAIAVDSKGIYAGGALNAYNDGLPLSARVLHHLARLHTDGTFDATFAVGTGFADAFVARVSSLLPMDDNSIAAAGHFTSYQGAGLLGLALLHTSDASAVPGQPGLSGASNFGNVLLGVGPFGSATSFVGGSFGNTPPENLAEFNASGALSTFAGSINPGTVTALGTYDNLLSDPHMVCAAGAIDLGGTFFGCATLSGPTFGELPTFEGGVATMLGVPPPPQVATSFFVGGSFFSDSAASPYLARFDIDAANGAPILNIRASQALQLGGPVNALTYASGLVFVGGAFASFGGQGARNLIAIDPSSGLRIK